MAYIGNQPSSVTNIKNEDIAEDAAIAISKLDNVTASNSDLNVLQGAAAAGVTADEVQHLDGVTSNIQAQLSAASGGATKGTLTKSFVTGETSTIALSSASTPTASVFVTKEVSQVGVSNGDWNINANDSGYDIQDFAYNEELSIDPTESTATLATSPWTADDVGKKIVGGGGEAILLDTLDNILITQPFDDASPVLTAGNWSLYGIQFNELGTGVSLTRGDGLSQTTFGVNRPHVGSSNDTFSYDTLLGSTTCDAIRFNNDGTKAYLLNTNADKIDTVDLASPYTLTGASSGNKSLSFSAEVSLGYDFRFGNSGSKVYVLGNDDTIYQYDLTTPYDVSSGAYANKSFVVTTQSTDARNIALDSTGTSMLVFDLTQKFVYQYSLSTAWDISTATYSSKSVNVGDTNTDGGGMPFPNLYGFDASPTFSRIFVMTNSPQVSNTRIIRTFALGSPADVGTAKYLAPFYNFGSTIRTFTIENNGNNIFLLDTASCYKYFATTPYMPGRAISGDSSTSEYRTVSLMESFSMAGDGTYVAHGGGSGTRIYLSRLSEPWNPMSNKFQTSTVATIITTTYPVKGMHLSPDGKYVTAVYNNSSVRQYEFTTPFDPSGGVTMTKNIATSSALGASYDVAFSPDGTRFYLAGNQTIYQWNLSVPYDISSISTSNFNFSLDPPSVGAILSLFCVNESKFILHSNSSNRFWTITLSDPTDISTGVEGQFVFTQGDYDALTSANLYSVRFNPEGTRMYAASDPTTIYHTALPGSFQIEGVYSLYTNTADSRGIAINADETKSYHLNTTGDILEYNLAPVPNVYDGETTTGNSFGATVHEATPQGITFSSDGSKLFVIGNSSNTVLRYSLATPFDISTATTTGYQSFGVTTQDNDCRGVRFNADGTKMYVAGSENNRVYQYTLTTSFDLTTASYDDLFINLNGLPIAAVDVNDLALNSSGTRMYVLCSSALTTEAYAFLAVFRLTVANSLSGAVFANLMNNLYGDLDFKSITVNSAGTRWYLGRDLDSYIFQGEYNSASVAVVPLDQYLAAITNNINQIDTEYWTDINSMSPILDLSNDGFVYYAISSDDQTTFKIADNDDGIRSIVRNNSGTWQYNSNTTYELETWTNAATNTKFDALGEALGVSVNRMTGNQLADVSDNNMFTVDETLDLAILLFQEQEGTPPVSDGVSINYDAQALNKGAILGTDYDYDVPTSTSVRITSLKDQNLKVKVV